MRIARAAASGAFLVVILFLASCGSKVSEVSGTVQVDGAPVEEGTISFTPASGTTQTNAGAIKGGKYSVKVPAGSMKVFISVPKVVGSKKRYDTPDSPEVPITEETLPEKYSSRKKTELLFDVVPGKNQKDWDLKTK